MEEEEEGEVKVPGGWGQQRHGAGAMCVVEADDVTPRVGGPAEIELDGSSDLRKNVTVRHYSPDCDFFAAAFEVLRLGLTLEPPTPGELRNCFFLKVQRNVRGPTVGGTTRSSRALKLKLGFAAIMHFPWVAL